VNLKEDGEVVVIDPKARRRRDWKVGRVFRTYPGEDGLMRVVDVKGGDTILQRPVSKLSPLEMQDYDFIETVTIYSTFRFISSYYSLFR